MNSNVFIKPHHHDEINKADIRTNVLLVVCLLKICFCIHVQTKYGFEGGRWKKVISCIASNKSTVALTYECLVWTFIQTDKNVFLGCSLTHLGYVCTE